MVTRAWDNTGAYGRRPRQITVSERRRRWRWRQRLAHASGQCIWFNNIQNRGNWSWCHDPGCAGGSGSGTYWMAQHQSSPSRSGSSMEFYNSGVWANALLWQKVGANNSVHNFLWDFWIYVDGDSQRAAQALEFDAFQFVDGYNYMIGSQCDYASGKWDTWNEASGHWVHSSRHVSEIQPEHVASHSVVYDHEYQRAHLHLRNPGGGRQSHAVNITGHAKNLALGRQPRSAVADWT